MMQACNLYDSIPIKGVKAQIGGRVSGSSPAELQIQYGDNSYLFIYRFGALVFFNVPAEKIEAETRKIKAALGEGLARPTSETLQICVGGTQDRVDFESVELKKASGQNLGLVAMTLAQSAALEYFELNADKMLQEASDFMQRFAHVASACIGSNVLLKFIGSAALARQHIVSNLAVLDQPEETWRNRELQRLFKDLQLTFDIDVRFRALDRKLALVQDNIEILANLVSNRRATLLELLIVFLILIEIVLGVLQKA